MPTYEDCQAAYEILLNDIQDLESETFSEHWCYRAKLLKIEHGCWEHFNRLIRLSVEMYPNHIGLIGIAGFTRNRSNVLSKEELTPWEKIEAMENAEDGFI